MLIAAHPDRGAQTLTYNMASTDKLITYAAFEISIVLDSNQKFSEVKTAVEGLISYGLDTDESNVDVSEIKWCSGDRISVIRLSIYNINTKKNVGDLQKLIHVRLEDKWNGYKKLNNVRCIDMNVQGT